MTIARRRLLKTLTLATGFGTSTNAQEARLALDFLRGVSTVHGTNLSDARLEIIKPALERRLSQLRALRGFEIDDAVAPTRGILAE